MNKTNDLSPLLTELSQTGQQLMEAGRTLMLTASRMQDCFPDSEDNEPKPKARKPRKEPEPISNEPVPEPQTEKVGHADLTPMSQEAPAEPEYTKEEIRGMLSDLAGNGHRDEAKALVAKYSSGGSFSDIDPAKYPELAEEVKQYG